MESQRVGPYRLERKLGAGGMGVVYAAWDERLERRVALKQIRPEGADDPRRRERFRREARAVAKLDHPAIVRIHDLLETPEGDWLVLQYVDGVTLAERLRQGPLTPEQVVSLARDVLSALEAAHAEGLLHRDLKAENVILARSGRGMVLDFGLAKLYAPDSPASATSLSMTGGLVGTYRSMSPEQANGLPLDPRSDLFSLGVLLYEAAAGVSPFQGKTPVETLTRVCTHLQPPLREVAPGVPEPFSALIDSLLEKDFERRPASAGETLARLEGGAVADPPKRWTDLPSTKTALVDEIGTERTVSATPYRGYRHPRHLPLILTLALVAALGLFLAWRLRSPREPLYVAVARPEVGLGADREEVAIAASALQTAALRGLSSLEEIAVLAPGRPEDGEPVPSPQKLARLQAADEVLTSSLDCQTRHCIAVLRRVRGSDGSLLDVQTFEVPLDDLRLLDTAVATYLKRGYEGFQTRPEASRLQVRAAAALYRHTLELVEQDPAPNFWQTLSIKAQAQAHLGRAPEAAASIQQAVVAAPDNPQVAFEASLVYAVIGDTASALASAGRALDSGYDRFWFSLPWFDPLRNDPAFRKRIENLGTVANRSAVR